MLNFQFYEKVKVLYGSGAVGQLGELAKHIGGTKALIVSDPGMNATGVIEKIISGLANENIPYVLLMKMNRIRRLRHARRRMRF